MKKLSLILPILFYMACTKPGDETTDKKKGHILNQSGDTLTFDIYRSRDDYNNNRNVVSTYRLMPNEDKEIPSVQPNSKYYVDWYNDEYLVTNWIRNDVEFTSDENGVLDIGVFQQDGHRIRLLLLEGNGTSSEWNAIDIVHVASPHSTYDWKNLAAYKKNKKFVFYKDETVVYTYTNEQGQQVAEKLYWWANRLKPIEQDIKLYTDSAQRELKYELRAGFGPKSPAQTANMQADTIRFTEGNWYYALLRKK